MWYKTDKQLPTGDEDIVFEASDGWCHCGMFINGNFVDGPTGELYRPDEVKGWGDANSVATDCKMYNVLRDVVASHEASIRNYVLED